MIVSFNDRKTEHIWAGKRSRALPVDIQSRGLNKLRLIDAAETLDDLRNPPGNHLEALTKDRSGQHSIRINRQWRICFVWKDGHAHDVEIVDYH